ncbi:MAG: dihydropteroate synthase, partial [Flavobacteriales bacterium]
KLLSELDLFQALDCPILAGVSRKSMIHKLLNINPEEALNGTTALHMKALDSGASILRVHDVTEAVESVKLFKALHS